MLTSGTAQKISVTVAVLVFLFTNTAFAGGVVKKRKAMKKRMMEAQRKAQMEAKAKAVAEAQAKAKAQTQLQAQAQTQLQRLTVENIRVNPQIHIKEQTLPDTITYESTITEINGERLSNILAENSVVWLQIIDQPVKEMVVARYIAWYNKRGIKIQKPAAQYVTLIDEMSQKNLTLLQQPFERVLKIVAIMEYDFDNGQDKDALARQLFDTDGYYENKKRLGMIP